MPQDPQEHNPDGIIVDEKSLAIKGKVMDRLRGKNVYDAVSKIAMFAGTMLTTATAGVVLGGLLHGGGWAALGAAMTTPVVAALAIGAAIIGVAVAADYVASYIGQGANFDIQEAAAHSTARQMRSEFESADLVVGARGGQDPRKNWIAQAEAEKARQQEAAQQRG